MGGEIRSEAPFAFDTVKFISFIFSQVKSIFSGTLLYSPISVILTLVSKRDRFFRPRRWNAPFFMTTDQQNDATGLTD